MKNMSTFFKSYRRHPLSLVLRILVWVAAGITALSLVGLILYILISGIPHLTPELFAWEYTSDNCSLLPAMVNTLIITALTLLIAVPFGIGSAIYLREYAKSGSRFVSLVTITTETLSGIPSIIYGLFGFLFFVTLTGKYSILAGSLTMSIMVLPLIMRTTQEALCSVSDGYREGSFALGAGKLRTVFRIVLPSAIPGILSGVILSIGRIVGETAALIFTAGTFAEIPKSLMDSGRTLSVHMYTLSQEGLHTNQAYATAVVLLVIILLLNLLSSAVAKKLSKKEG